MLNIEQAVKQDRLLRALTGLNLQGFDALLLTFTEIYEQTRPEKQRKRAVGGELSEVQKQENRLLSSSRVVCENALAGVKRYSAVSQIYRNRIQILMIV